MITSQPFHEIITAMLMQLEDGTGTAHYKDCRRCLRGRSILDFINRHERAILIVLLERALLFDHENGRDVSQDGENLEIEDVDNFTVTTQPKYPELLNTFRKDTKIHLGEQSFDVSKLSDLIDDFIQRALLEWVKSQETTIKDYYEKSFDNTSKDLEPNQDVADPKTQKIASESTFVHFQFFEDFLLYWGIQVSKKSANDILDNLRSERFRIEGDNRQYLGIFELVAQIATYYTIPEFASDICQILWEKAVKKPLLYTNVVELRNNFEKEYYACFLKHYIHQLPRNMPEIPKVVSVIWEIWLQIRPETMTSCEFYNRISGIAISAIDKLANYVLHFSGNEMIRPKIDEQLFRYLEGYAAKRILDFTYQDMHCSTGGTHSSENMGGDYDEDNDQNGKFDQNRSFFDDLDPTTVEFEFGMEVKSRNHLPFRENKSQRGSLSPVPLSFPICKANSRNLLDENHEDIYEDLISTLKYQDIFKQFNKCVFLFSFAFPKTTQRVHALVWLRDGDESYSLEIVVDPYDYPDRYDGIKDITANNLDGWMKTVDDNLKALGQKKSTETVDKDIDPIFESFRKAYQVIIKELKKSFDSQIDKLIATMLNKTGTVPKDWSDYDLVVVPCSIMRCAPYELLGDKYKLGHFFNSITHVPSLSILQHCYRNSMKSLPSEKLRVRAVGWDNKEKTSTTPSEGIKYFFEKLTAICLENDIDLRTASEYPMASLERTNRMFGESSDVGVLFGHGSSNGFRLANAYFPSNASKFPPMMLLISCILGRLETKDGYDSFVPLIASPMLSMFLRKDSPACAIGAFSRPVPTGPAALFSTELFETWLAHYRLQPFGFARAHNALLRIYNDEIDSVLEPNSKVESSVLLRVFTLLSFRMCGIQPISS